MSFSTTSSSFLSNIKHEIAKAVQRGAEEVGIGGVYEDIPDCSLLNSVDVLSIKLAQPNEREQAISRSIFTSSDTSRVVFSPISYLIRDERHRKRTIMTADLMCNRGFVVKCGDKCVMELKMPNRSMNSIGKICHPFGATIYKVSTKITYITFAITLQVERRRPMIGGTIDTATGYTVVRRNTGQPIMIVEKVLVSLYPIAKLFGLLNTDCVYWFKSADSTTILGYVRPKLVLKKSTLIVKYMAASSDADAQTRATMLGTSLLLLLADADPVLGRLLNDSIAASSPSSP
jgi:hypothetical protein